MENKKNGSAVKIIKIKLKSCQAHWLKRQKVKLRYKKATQRKRKAEQTCEYNGDKACDRQRCRRF